MTKELLLKIFDSAYMQRWNDKLRPIQFIEIDKQAHKLMIAYFLGKFEETIHEVNWMDIIEGTFFEFLQRLITTDIKPTITSSIRRDAKRRKELDMWIYNRLKPILEPLGPDFNKRYIDHFERDDNTLSKRIISASHLLASKWEFDIIEKSNPNAYDIDFIRKWFETSMENYYDLEGVKQLALYKNYSKFIDLCGQLRFQTRWSNLLRFPTTSVLGHSLSVAYFSYLMSVEIGASPKRVYNNTFTGLFHDLPEVLTRDIISPVKNSVDGISDLIKQCEKEQMDAIVYPLIPEMIKKDIRHYTENEFDDIVTIDDKITNTTGDEINEKYNSDTFSPRDGKLVKAADELSAYIEAYSAIKNGSNIREFIDACHNISKKYIEKGSISGINIGRLYESFLIDD